MIFIQIPIVCLYTILTTLLGIVECLGAWAGWQIYKIVTEQQFGPGGGLLGGAFGGGAGPLPGLAAANNQGLPGPVNPTAAPAFGGPARQQGYNPPASPGQQNMPNSPGPSSSPSTSVIPSASPGDPGRPGAPNRNPGGTGQLMPFAGKAHKLDD